MISDNDVKKLARLARLALTEEELARYGRELNSILGYVDNLLKADVEGVSPMSHVHGSVNVFREDVTVPSMPVEEGLKNAPARSGTFFKVPLIIE